MSGDVPVLAYYRGDDGYLIDRAVDAVASSLERSSGIRPERWLTSGVDTTAAAITEHTGTAPLFGGGTVAVVVDPGPLMRSKDSREAVEAALRTVAPGNALVFVEQGDGGARRAASLQALETAVARAGGTTRVFKAPTEGGLSAWIEGRARERGLQLAPGAARELARRVGGFVREGDVDRQRQGSLAVAELDKLALYRGDGAITEDDVRSLVAEVVPDSTWAFLDAVGERRADAAGALLDRLLEATPEPVILAQLHRRLRELAIAADLLAAHAPPAELVRAIGGHPYRVQKLAEQAGGWRIEELETALEGVLDLDASVKGVPGAYRTDAQRRLAFALWVRDCVGRPGGGAARPARAPARAVPPRRR